MPSAQIYNYFISLHPIGTNAAATCPAPRSVANRLNCAAAFRVSCTSSLSPSPFKYCLTLGASGMIVGPVPMMRISVYTPDYQLHDLNRDQEKRHTYQASDKPTPTPPTPPPQHPTAPSHSSTSPASPPSPYPTPPPSPFPPATATT